LVEGARREGSGRITITNADLRRAFGSDETDGAATDSGEQETGPGVRQHAGAMASRLTIVEARHHAASGRVHVAGILRNDGVGVARRITVEAQAVDSSGRPIGTGASALSYDLEPGDDTGFSFVFNVARDVEDVQVRAGATMVVLNEE
jgi:hypothetical protein